ncbi:MAG TPA: response regulator [Thermoanaerobaculia bacterium]|jgi:CheY-like chemotaxis protein
MVALTETPAIPHRIVLCSSCSTPFDTFQAAWCSCVTKTISPSCPRCGFCLCKSTPNASRNFWFRAPQELIDRRNEEERRRARRGPEAVALGAKRVLIVDDDEEIRFIADYALREMGYVTLTASSAELALEIVDREMPDVVLTDALMPKLDGRELCRRIKAKHPRVKVVVMTSLYTSARYRDEAYRVFHADDYLAKPIDFQKLEQSLERLTTKGAAA